MDNTNVITNCTLENTTSIIMDIIRCYYVLNTMDSITNSILDTIIMMGQLDTILNKIKKL